MLLVFLLFLLVRTPQRCWSSEVSPSRGDELNDKKFVPKIGKRGYPECANGSTFCESVDDYPDSHIQIILRDSYPQFRDLFGKDYLESNSTMTRRIEGVDEHPLCVAEATIVFPKTAVNKRNQWLFIVNQEGYNQGMRVEKCVHINSPCDFHASFPMGYTTKCTQKFIYRKLLAVSGAGNPVVDSFQLPSCCVCFVRGVENPTKSGNGLSAGQPSFLLFISGLFLKS